MGLVSDGLGRFGRDVLGQPGLTHIITSLGLNDMGTGWPGGLYPSQAVSVEQMIQGYRQLIVRAHTKGGKIYGAKITRFEGAFVAGTPFALHLPANEAKRQQVSRWIRTSNAFDGVIDFDLVLRDPSNPAQILSRYDSGDHLHPNDTGQQAMAEAIDLGCSAAEDAIEDVQYLRTLC